MPFVRNILLCGNILFGRVSSTVRVSEAVRNKAHRLRAAHVYYPAKIVTPEGTSRALFTDHQLRVAMKRAEANSDLWPN